MSKPPAVPNELFIYERKRRHWTQKYVAEQIEAPDQKTIRRWEQGEVLPSPYYCEKLAGLFGKSVRELGFLTEDHRAYWYVPHRRNAFFTGREDILHLLREAFLMQTGAKNLLPLALSGLGGVGKSGIANEYVYRYRGHYHTVLWVQATSVHQLVQGFTNIADLLGLPEKDAANSDQAIKAVKTWLTELTRWLLILDNVDDFQILERFMPDEIKGHILLTTRSQSIGTLARQIAVEPLHIQEGAELLLRRAKLLPLERMLEQAAPADVALARSLSEELGGLPLVLDQAGAYIEENRCSLPDYLARYTQNQTQKMRLLQERGRLHGTYPLSVVTTWSLAFENIQCANPAAVELLHLCAFLAPDSIPEEFVIKGTLAFDSRLRDLARDAILFDQALGALLRYSFIRRNAESHMLSIHRLVQAVLQDAMEQEERRLWVQHAVQAVNAVFPDPAFGGTWPQHDWSQCEQLVQHGLQLAEHIEAAQIVNKEAGALLHKTALYLWNRRQFTEVEHLYQRAIQIRQQLFGSEHPDIAASLNGLANLYYEQSRYTEAESLYQQALYMRECLLGPEHPDLVSSLNGLAKLYYYAKADYTRAEALYQRAIYTTEKRLGQAHPYRAYLLMNVANLYSEQEKYEQAKSHYRSAIHIWEQQLGPNHPSTALAFNNLGALYFEERDYVQAEACFLQARQILERLLGGTHPDFALALNNLADVYLRQAKYTEAEPLYHQALLIKKQHFGHEDAHLAYPLSGLGDLYRLQEKFEEALQHYKHALRLRKKAFGLRHPGTAEILDGLGQLQEALGNYEKARILYARVQAIREQVFGFSHSSTRGAYQRLLALLHTMGRHSEAIQIEEMLQVLQNAAEVQNSSE